MLKLSVIVPVYNVAPYLRACMDSLCGQTLSDIEIIAVNDASTDNSLEILREYEQKDNRVRIIDFAKNQKTAAARNAGLDAATGEYVGFVDGDDYLDAEFYERLYTLAKSENSDIAKGLTCVISPQGTSLTAENTIIRADKFAFMGNLLSGIYSRDMIKKHNIQFHIDFFCFQIQAVYFANKIVTADDVFYNYVRHENSCDSDVFTLEKWQQLNLGHAQFISDWVCSHEYSDIVRKNYLKRVQRLRFYGFNKLARKDIASGAKILAPLVGKSVSYLVRKHPQVSFKNWLFWRFGGKL